jgi:hypothetical protein
MKDLVESEGRASCRTCIRNNEGMTSFRGSVVFIEFYVENWSALT